MDQPSHIDGESHCSSLSRASSSASAARSRWTIGHTSAFAMPDASSFGRRQPRSARNGAHRHRRPSSGCGPYDAAVAYDEALAERIRELVAAEANVTEQAMFGGLAFLINGNMAIAAS